MIDNQGRRSSKLFLQTVIKQSMHIVKRSIPHIPLVSNNRLRYYGTTVTMTTTTMAQRLPLQRRLWHNGYHYNDNDNDDIKV